MKYIFYLDVTYGSTDALHNNTSFNDLLRPYQQLTAELEENGIEVRSSADIPKKSSGEETGIYYSFRSHREYKKYIHRSDIYFGSFYIMEPVVVRPDRYRKLPELTKFFQKVYLPNTSGDGYSLKSVNEAKLNRIYFPQAYDQIQHEYWAASKQKSISIVNANKIPKNFKNELYGERIKALIELKKYISVELFGKGWGSWKKRASYRPIFLKNRKFILESYKGEIESKFDILSKFEFSLCFENMLMTGYITEKIFDCFFVGTIPIYLGETNIENSIPNNCFIDARKFNNYKEIAEYILSLSTDEIEEYRSNVRKFMLSDKYLNVFSPRAFVEHLKSEVLEYIEDIENGKM